MWEDPKYRDSHSGENHCWYGKQNDWTPSRGDSVHAKPVVCLNTGKEYDCITSAEIATGAQNIAYCCKGKRKASGIVDDIKLVWAYKEDYEKMSETEIQSKIKNANKQRVTHKVVNLDTKELFSKIKSAADKYSIKKACNINAACNGTTKTCKGYHWQYYEDYLKENNLTDEEARKSLIFVE